MKTHLKIAIAIFSWALAWVSIRAAIEHYSPGQLAFGRYLIASLCLLPLWLWRRPRFSSGDWGLCLAGGVCGLSIYNLCIGQSEKTITAGAAALVGSTIPILATFAAQIFLGERASRSAWSGGALAFAGVVLIALGEARESPFWGLSSGAFLVLIACCGAAAFNVLQKKLLARHAALDIITASIFCATLSLAPVSGGLIWAVQTAPLSSTLHMLVLGIFPGALGYVFWSQALAEMPVARLVPFLYLIAPLTIVLGAVLLGELPSALALFGGALALGGVVYAAKK